MILLLQSIYDGINIESESTITFTGAEISGIQTSISSLFSVLQKKCPTFQNLRTFSSF